MFMACLTRSMMKLTSGLSPSDESASESEEERVDDGPFSDLLSVTVHCDRSSLGRTRTTSSCPAPNEDDDAPPALLLRTSISRSLFSSLFVSF
jgi:hypothetical protein